MDEIEKLEKIQRKVVHQDRELSLSISRVPKQTKQNFIEFAKEGFCDDYGMALREIMGQYIEYQQLKHMFFTGKIRLVLEQPQPVVQEKEPKTIKTLDGRTIKLKEQEEKGK